jgi:CxxC-x17-CxxC domain-containing protein
MLYRRFARSTLSANKWIGSQSRAGPTNRRFRPWWLKKRSASVPREQRERKNLDPSRGETEMPDLEITCSECSTPFTFTEREQEYYRERNLTHPKRCKPCRDARRANFGGSRGPGGERQRFEITCDQCGKTDSVPFKPSTGRPVLCSDCFSASRATQQQRN